MHKRFCLVRVDALTVDGVVPYFGASENRGKVYFSMIERVNKARNAEHHRCSDGVQRSLQEQRVYGGCLGFKKR